MDKNMRILHFNKFKIYYKNKIFLNFNKINLINWKKQVYKFIANLIFYLHLLMDILLKMEIEYIQLKLNAHILKDL